MHKVLKRILITLLILVILFVAFLFAWVYLLFPFFDPNKDSTITEQPAVGPAAIAEESEQIDCNEENGLVYVNNEIVVMAYASVSSMQIERLCEKYDAELDDTMADIGMYRFIFPQAMTYEELEDLEKELSESDLIEKAYLNLVTEMSSDTITAGEEEDDFETSEPFFPVDDWDGDGWDVAVPRGNNWGMEAINAPGAWGYLDRINPVNIGLIDSMPNTAHADLTFDSSHVNLLFIDEKTGLTNINKYTMSADNHGTHVAGIMSADFNDTTGVAGVMGDKGTLYYSAVYFDRNGNISSRYGTAYTYVLALKNLIDQDVQVINISQNTSRLVGFAASHGNQNAINYLSKQAELAQNALERLITSRQAAGKPDFVVCVAAGNSNSTYYYKDDAQTYGYREEMTWQEKVKHLFGWKGEIGSSQALYNNFLSLMDTPEVKDRFIVVGAIQIDDSRSTSTGTAYAYTDFSNIGSRVDIVAPGYDVYSCAVYDEERKVYIDYDAYAGTSMATPHVAGVAGLVFGCNPDLTGPQVKSILMASTKGRYNYEGGYSGLIDAETAVINALKTNDETVNRVLQTQTTNGLDLCFVVDTTGSMGDDIDNARANMESILTHLAEKTENYRVALIDYRDFSSRTGDSEDYPACVQLRFTADNAEIIDAINGLDLGYGGDLNETVYSGLREALRLNWRKDAKKVIIILGDAPPLDPEPETNLTYDQILLELYHADINLDYEDSDDRVVGSIDDCLINVFSIGANASDDASDFFQKLSESTGGSYADVSDASGISDAIIDSIEQIEVTTKLSITADFSESFANRRIDLYKDDAYLFSFHTDERGQFALADMDPETYQWRCDEMYAGGTLIVEKDRRMASTRNTKTYWFTPVQMYWQQHKALVVLYALGAAAVCILIPITMAGIKKAVGKKKSARSAEKSAETPAQRGSEPPTTATPDTVHTTATESTPQESPTEMKICPACGTACKQHLTFCTECGAKLDTPEN